jgi:hypothetical protein
MALAVVHRITEGGGDVTPGIGSGDSVYTSVQQMWDYWVARFQPVSHSRQIGQNRRRKRPTVAVIRRQGRSAEPGTPKASVQRCD